MRRDLRAIVSTLGPLPEDFAAAGVDYRIAVIRFATGRIHKGPDYPEVLVDFTTDGPFLRSRIATLQSRIVGPTEAGSEAFDLALDSLTFRPNAIPVFLLFTDEDDDLPKTIEEGPRREPPGRDWLTNARTPIFQARLDEVAQRLIGLQARLVMLINRKNKPTEFQYGASRATVLDSQNHLDMPATLAYLTAHQMQRSLQGQLLSAGVCGGTTCTGGRLGFPCATDGDCSLPARAYEISLARRKGSNIFFEALRSELVDFGNCAP
jgi:hypothetical protein